MTTAIVIAALVVNLIGVVLARRVARSKGRAPEYWGLGALLLGPLVVGVVSLLPRRPEPSDPAPSVSP